ncbi:transporter [Paraburkholderia graminis]|uniref:transporter n=1 Tax=Paraburkholderia TaxID=1822464 RepID=UPI0021593551|nr:MULTISPECIES: transporter [unclassified Paraburkholderia]
MPTATGNGKWLQHATAAVVLLWPTLSCAQEMEPRAYSAAPTGTNFIVASYARSTGGMSLDPTLPVTDVSAKINTYLLGYSHTFGIAGHAASFALAVPYNNADLSGNVQGVPGTAWRSGMGDAAFRFAANVLGGPALPPEEFARRQATTTLGASLTVIAPTGQYVPSRLINVGSNRWAFRPELGLSQPLGDWFVEGAAGVWLFTDNNQFFGGHQRSQAPIPVLQWHSGYTWRPGLWLSADLTYFSGGRTSVDGVENHDLQSSVRYGVTLSIPLASHWSAKLAWSHGLITRVGSDFQTVSLSLQYRWFNQ